MWISILTASFAAAISDSTFPDWRIAIDTGRVRAGRPSGAAPSRDRNGSWIVVSEHPALRRDSLASVDVTMHPLLTALLWPVDHAVRPLMGVPFKPLRPVVRYGEGTELVERGLAFVHPTGREGLMLYPTAVLDGSSGSRWGATFVDRDFFREGWRLQLNGALSVAADGYMSASTRTHPIGPRSTQLRMATSYSISRGVGVRVPGYRPVSDPEIAGSTSETRVLGELGAAGPGAFEHSSWDASYQLAHREVGAPRRLAADFVDPGGIDWFSGGDRGIRGTEIDHTFGMWLGWSDQENPGAPSKGGRLSTRMWYTYADGGGDVAGIDAQATRYFLLGTERYVYKKGDLEPYLDLDPMRVIRMLDPTTLRQRLTQRKILAVYFRMIRLWELEAGRHPASYFLFPGLGGDAPARAYGGRYLLDRAVVGGTMEYRWPIWKYIDGTAFAELAWAAPEWWEPDLDRLAPGIGGGIRVRMPRMFLFRVQAAFGLAGPQLIATTDAEF